MPPPSPPPPPQPGQGVPPVAPGLPAAAAYASAYGDGENVPMEQMLDEYMRHCLSHKYARKILDHYAGQAQDAPVDENNQLTMQGAYAMQGFVEQYQRDHPGSTFADAREAFIRANRPWRPWRS